MDASAYAFAHGVRHTRATLHTWQQHPPRDPRPLARRLLPGGLRTARAVLVVSALSPGYVQIVTLQPPFAVGGGAEVLGILGHNMLVLALHAMACVAGFIAGSSLPLQASSRSGLSRWVHAHGGRIAIAFVVCATAFSLSIQASRWATPSPASPISCASPRRSCCSGCFPTRSSS